MGKMLRWKVTRCVKMNLPGGRWYEILKDETLRFLMMQVWSVNAHATSTPLGDRAECTALRQVVKESCLITSNKGSLGHTLGAAGALESIFSVLSLVQGIVPPCANLENTDPDCSTGLNLVQGSPHIEKDQGGLRIVLKNSFGFGGTNVSLVFRSVASSNS